MHLLGVCRRRRRCRPPLLLQLQLQIRLLFLLLPSLCCSFPPRGLRLRPGNRKAPSSSLAQTNQQLPPHSFLGTRDPGKVQAADPQLPRIKQHCHLAVDKATHRNTPEFLLYLTQDAVQPAAAVLSLSQLGRCRAGWRAGCRDRAALGLQHPARAGSSPDRRLRRLQARPWLWLPTATSPGPGHARHQPTHGASYASLEAQAPPLRRPWRQILDGFGAHQAAHKPRLRSVQPASDQM